MLRSLFVRLALAAPLSAVLLLSTPALGAILAAPPDVCAAAVLPEEASEVALDQGDGYAQNVVSLSADDLDPCERGERYVITPVDQRAAYAEAARRLVPVDMQALVREAARAYGVNEALYTAIVRCESGFNPSARNPYAVVGGQHASGLAQFLPFTFAYASRAAGYGGYSIFDPVANAYSGAWLLAHEGTAPWLASRRCWGGR